MSVRMFRHDNCGASTQLSNLQYGLPSACQKLVSTIGARSIGHSANTHADQLMPCKLQVIESTDIMELKGAGKAVISMVSQPRLSIARGCFVLVKGPGNQFNRASAGGKLSAAGNRRPAPASRTARVASRR